MSTAVTETDIAIVGGGVVGCAVARRLARTHRSVTVLEAGPDIGASTSKANTAILHTGFDTKPGTTESALVRRGHALLEEYAPSAGIAVERTGALLVAWTEGQREVLPHLAAQAADVGYERCEVVDAATCYQREPALGPGAYGGLTVPDESIIDPFSTPLAFATEAVLNDATLHRGSPVIGIDTRGDHFEITTPNRIVRATWLVNAAGLYADDIEHMLGHDDLRVTPRRGQLIVFDKLSRALVQGIVLPVPSGRTKGVLVAPTVFGNVMLGPTAEDLDDKTDRASTVAGIETLMQQCRGILPALVDEEVTAVYAGLRTATDDPDYRLAFRPDERTVRLTGIRSTGLTASMALAEWVADCLSDAGVDTTERGNAKGVQVPNLGEAFPRPYQDVTKIDADADYGRIVCHCERVTAGEISDALTSTIPAVDLDGLRRRTRVLMGRCQGFYCSAEVVTRVATARNCSPETVLAVPQRAAPPQGGLRG